MFNRTRIGIALTQHSASILRAHKHLLVFPILGNVICFMMTLTAVAPLALSMEKTAWLHPQQLHFKTIFPLFLVFLFLLLIMTFTKLLFQAAFIACALKIIKHESYTLRTGFNIFVTHFKRLYFIKQTIDIGIMYYAFCEYWIDDQSKTWMGARYLLKLPFRIAITFVIPVLIEEKLKPLLAIQHSAQLIKNKWGASIGGLANIQWIILLISLIALAPTIAAVIISGKTALIIGSALTAILLLIITIFNSALHMMSLSAVYVFAMNVQTPYFPNDLLTRAFEKHTLK